MVARFSLIQLGPGTRAQAEKLAGRHASIYRRQRGFRSVVFLGDVDRGEYGSMTVWDTREDAEAAAEAIHQVLQKDLSELGLHMQGPPSPRLFEVYEPKE
jgi:heme-degrading monooxygenase HmoA